MSTAPGYLPQGYKTSKKTHRVDGPPGVNNTETVHWDGRQDAHVRAKPVSVSMKVESVHSEEGK